MMLAVSREGLKKYSRWVELKNGYIHRSASLFSLKLHAHASDILQHRVQYLGGEQEVNSVPLNYCRRYELTVSIFYLGNVYISMEVFERLINSVFGSTRGRRVCFRASARQKRRRSC